MNKITPFLWFNGNAEEAMHYYLGIFKNSRLVNILRATDAGPGPKGSVVTVTFELNGQEFIALNGGPQFPFTHAVSFFIYCETQAEVDYYWEKLSVGGEKVECGWLKDKFGVSWQVVPTILLELLNDKDTVRAGKVMQAMMQMTKLDIAVLKRASEK
jgi:predicted 3-demethylubiquinone-9 3-methyltransferase (glyoxalase superfamily)